MELADTIIQGDPPIDALSMLEVAADSRDQFRERAFNARAYMQEAALRALVDGHDPALIAERCGFKSKKAEASLDDHMADFWGSMWSTESRSRSPEDQLAAWLCERVNTLAKAEH